MKHVDHLKQELREELVSEDKSLVSHKKDFLTLFDRMITSKPALEQDDFFKSQLKDRLRYHLITQYEDAPEISRWQSLLLYGIPSLVVAGVLMFTVAPLKDWMGKTSYMGNGAVELANTSGEMIDRADSGELESLPSNLQEQNTQENKREISNTAPALDTASSHGVSTEANEPMARTMSASFDDDQDSTQILEHDEWILSYDIDGNLFEGSLMFKDNSELYKLVGTLTPPSGALDVGNQIVEIDVLSGETTIETISMEFSQGDVIKIIDWEELL